jgi:hypothetical protein
VQLFQGRADEELELALVSSALDGLTFAATRSLHRKVVSEEASMEPEDRKLLRGLMAAVEAQGEMQAKFLQRLDGQMAALLFRNEVLTSACGSLYAELARVAGAPGELDEMLARLTATLENNPDSAGHVLAATDELRKFAEALGSSFDLE